MKFLRMRIAIGPMKRLQPRPLLRCEREGDDVIVSPLLAAAGPICETCWRKRRAATLPPSAPAPFGSGTGLLDAFELRVAHSSSPLQPRQRAAMAGWLRIRRSEAFGWSVPSQPPTLARILAAGDIDVEPVLPMPDCPVCRPGRALQPNLRHVLGRAAGIICGIQAMPARPGEPCFPHVVVTTRANSNLLPGWRFGIGSSGKGATLEAAIGSAIGEAVERYAANTAPPGSGRRRPAPSEAFLSLGELAGTATAEVSRPPDAKDGAWVVARAVDPSGPCRLVPAAAVYFAPTTPQDPASPIRTTSSGLAAAPTLTEAIARGFAELVERHLFFLVWYGARSPELARARGLLDPVPLQAFEAAGLETRAIVLGRLSGIVAAAACCWPSDAAPGRPQFAIGLGTGAEPVAAARSAFLELGQVYRGLSLALADPGLDRRSRQLAAGEVAVTEPFDHGLLYARRPPGTVPAPFGDAPHPGGAVSIGPCAPPEACYVDLTPPDIAAYTAWHVVRVLAPGLVPYHVGSGAFPDALLQFSDLARPPFVLLHPLS